LLVNTRYFDYVEEMAKQQQEVRSRLDDFIPKYADLKDKAKQALADLSDESKYPAIATIRDQFGLDFDFETLPKGDAFEGSSLANDQATALASALTKRSQLAMRNAMQEVWQRSYKAVSHMAERLSDPEGRFKATTLDNVSEAAELLKHCNLTRDPRLDQLYKEIQGKLTHHDPKELRKNKETRAAVAADARTIRDKIRELGAA
jgi:hypothetical protein